MAGNTGQQCQGWSNVLRWRGTQNISQIHLWRQFWLVVTVSLQHCKKISGVSMRLVNKCNFAIGRSKFTGYFMSSMLATVGMTAQWGRSDNTPMAVRLSLGHTLMGISACGEVKVLKIDNGISIQLLYVGTFWFWDNWHSKHNCRFSKSMKTLLRNFTIHTLQQVLCRTA